MPYRAPCAPPRFLRRRLPALLALLLAAGLAAQAQTPLGQPTLDEQKVQVWCATARYVYADLGHPRLTATLRCDTGQLSDLAASLRPDSARVYSLLYQPIEERGRIYRGLKDNHARLAALVRAIVGKLRASPSRQRDAQRLAGLRELEKKLTDYVETGLPPATVAPAPQAAAPADASLNNGPAERAEDGTASVAAPAPAATAPLATTPLLDRILTPLALSFSLLSLVLYVLLRISLGRTLRQLRRTATLLGENTTELTLAQRRQVEELVAQRVALELGTAGQDKAEAAKKP